MCVCVHVYACIFSFVRPDPISSQVNHLTMSNEELRDALLRTQRDLDQEQEDSKALRGTKILSPASS
jgi:hypothetical protein